MPEDAEGDSMIKFVENLLTTELPLPEGMSLKIQRAHRALAQKPGPDATPRSIVINFLQFDVKETVLKQAWKKKVLINDKQVFTPSTTWGGSEGQQPLYSGKSILLF